MFLLYLSVQNLWPTLVLILSIIILVFTFYRINLLIWRESTIHLKSWTKGSYEENKTLLICQRFHKEEKNKPNKTWSDHFTEAFWELFMIRPAVSLIHFVTWCTGWDSSDFPCATRQINRAQGKSTWNLNSFHILKQTNLFWRFTTPFD